MNRAGGRVQSRGVCAALLLLAMPRSAWGQGFATTVRGAVTPDDTAAVSRVDLGLPGERGAPSAGKTSLAEAMLYEAGAIKPLIGERVPMIDAPAAMDRVASRGSVGKVILVP